MAIKLEIELFISFDEGEIENTMKEYGATTPEELALALQFASRIDLRDVIYNNTVETIKIKGTVYEKD